MSFISLNPFTGRELFRWPRLEAGELEAQLARSAAAQPEWAARPLMERLEILERAGDLLEERARPLAVRMAEEMGKPLSQGLAEARKCATVCRWLAGHAARVLADRVVATEARRSFVCQQPLGLVLAIMPWNFPLWQVVRAALPALAAGNGVLLKHAPTTQGCAEDLCALLREAGLPADLLPNLRLEPEAVAELIGDPRVAAVTLTGSTQAGRRVAELAGRHLKKCVLELGGSDPGVVLLDADLELAAATLVASRMINNGQSCIASKRFIAPLALRRDFEPLVLEKMRAHALGDPLDEECRLGPLARADLRTGLDDQVRRSVAAGARLLCGGTIPAGPGHGYPASVLTDVAPGQPAFDEELFGPVAALGWAHDETEALAWAARSRYGLGASVFTRDLERGEALARAALPAGAVFVNALVRSDPRLPFGGIRDSGFGRELADEGLREFVNCKSIYIA
ncbi:MAG: NAD-dependent succinate-semialdehyde dehydrogenase [Candidatus Delongbacteria bacterium]